MAGRKSFKDEQAVLRRFNELAPKVFKFVQEMIDSSELEDRKWAADWVKPGYAKMIPQKIGGDPDNRTPIPILGGITITQNNENEGNDKSVQ